MTRFSNLIRRRVSALGLTVAVATAALATTLLPGSAHASAINDVHIRSHGENCGYYGEGTVVYLANDGDRTIHVTVREVEIVNGQSGTSYSRYTIHGGEEISLGCTAGGEPVTGTERFDYTITSASYSNDE